MRVVAYDVGICNLARCVVERDAAGTRVLSWAVTDLRGDGGLQDCAEAGCAREPRWACGGRAFCDRHRRGLAPAQARELRALKVAELRARAEAEGLAHAGLRKPELLAALLGHLGGALRALPRVPRAKDVSLDRIHERILASFTPEVLGADRIVIENQPVRLNAKMKSVQMILWTALRQARGGRGSSVGFVNASRKLTVHPTGPMAARLLPERAAAAAAGRRDYAARKRESVARARALVEGSEWAAQLRALPKADDVADCLLMCMYALESA